MSGNLALLILTFVLTLSSLVANAAPHDHAPSPTQNKTEQSSKEVIDWDERNLSVSSPPLSQADLRKKTYEYFPYRQSMSPRIGVAYDSTSETDQHPYLFGLTYMFERRHSPQWEVGFDLLSNSAGLLHLGSKHTYNQRSYFRPFYKYGISHYFVSKDQLASFVNYENYMVTISGGFEKVLIRPMSLRMEVEASWGAEHQLVSLFLGYSWAW